MTVNKNLLSFRHIFKLLLRRFLWLKILAIFVVFIFIVKMMSSNSALPTSYEYFKIKSGSNVGLSDNDPAVFKLNGKDIRITSGTIHYFRVHPHYWRDRLRRLRAMGALAVETYVAWNLHEPEKDIFDFGDKNYEMSKFLDIVKFINMAKEEDLFVILRPGPYICAEWEFGGLPSYLLHSNVKLRTSDSEYMARVELYLKQVISRVAPLQVYYGGPIIMVQVENEYGSLYDLDHEYMVQLKKIMVEQGLKGLFFTADSPVPYGSKGSLADENVLQTANFKTEGQMQLETLKQLQPQKPAMVMEFWTGWFDHWDEPMHHTWDVKEYATALEEVLNFPASVNLYVFHGGTTFGFLNGANEDSGNPDTYHPDTTSYDYDALITEAGDYTEKYFITRALFLLLPELRGIYHPMPPPGQADRLNLTVPVTHELSWYQIVQQMPPPNIEDSKTFIHMEDLGQSFGFVRYSQTIRVNKQNPRVQLKGPIRDIVTVLVDGVRQTSMLYEPTQIIEFGYWGAKNASLALKIGPGTHTIDYLVENCGRTNFVKSLVDLPKKKGLGPENQVLYDGADVDKKIVITSLPFSSDWISSLTGWNSEPLPGQKAAPTLYKAVFTLRSEQLHDTFLDISKWKRGIVYVNGFNIGRYFSGGPQLTLYIPAPLLRIGENVIIIFEHYASSEEIHFVSNPIFL